MAPPPLHPSIAPCAKGSITRGAYALSRTYRDGMDLELTPPPQTNETGAGGPVGLVPEELADRAIVEEMLVGVANLTYPYQILQRPPFL